MRDGRQKEPENGQVVRQARRRIDHPQPSVHSCHDDFDNGSGHEEILDRDTDNALRPYGLG